MERRTFLKATGLATATLWLPEFLKASENKTTSGAEKILIVVQLTGGNDGLNTVIPYENDIYYRLRPQIAVQKNDAWKLNDELGLHPSLKDIKELYDDGNVCLINNVGYPEPDRSHFRSMDIWQTASGSREYMSSGWLGRFLDLQVAKGKSATQILEIDDTLSLALKGSNASGLALKDPRKLYMEVSDPLIEQLSKLPLTHDHIQDNASYLYQTLASTASSAEYLYTTSKIIHSPLTYPNHAFGKSMKTISELIVSGVDAKVYYVSLGSFDTHFNQVKRQADLLKQMSETIGVFMKDMKANGKSNDVLLMTFSEFGRRVQENASQGTDHGTANQIFLFGEGLKKKGILNNAPDLTDLEDGDLKFSVDFRSVYATLLRRWLNVDDTAILNGKFDGIDFL